MDVPNWCTWHGDGRAGMGNLCAMVLGATMMGVPWWLPCCSGGHGAMVHATMMALPWWCPCHKQLCLINGSAIVIDMPWRGAGMACVRMPHWWVCHDDGRVHWWPGNNDGYAKLMAMRHWWSCHIDGRARMIAGLHWWPCHINHHAALMAVPQQWMHPLDGCDEYAPRGGRCAIRLTVLHNNDNACCCDSDVSCQANICIINHLNTLDRISQWQQGKKFI